MSSVPRVRRVTVTIPGSAGPAVSLQSLVLAAIELAEPGYSEMDAKCLMGGRINRVAAAYVAGDSPSDLPLTVPVGEIYEEPCTNFLASTFVKASGAGTISAVVSVYLTAR
jgi:hypothetical protein